MQACDVDAATLPAPGLTLGEVVDGIATWALMATVVGLCWLGETLHRRDERRRGR